MKIIFLILAVSFLVRFVIVYIYTQQLIHIGTDLALNTEAFSRKSPTGKQFLIVGDSTAVGTGATSKTDSIAGRIGSDYRDASITNLGVNGARTHELISILTSLRDKHYDFILIQVGANDIIYRTNLDELMKSIDFVLVEATKHSDHILLMTAGNIGTSKLFPLGTRWFFTKRTRVVREIFIKASKKNNVSYVDLFRERKNDPFAKNPEKYYAKDLFHPSSEGYADWYTFVKTELEKIT